jgi:cation-transporting ATPase 13A2
MGHDQVCVLSILVSSELTNRDWRDPKWSSARAVANGLDEVLHPFYVFQIASILLWSIDDYYYYAFAIAVISISSILGTLFETKRTVERMREMSRFHCDVRVLVEQQCKLNAVLCVGWN